MRTYAIVISSYYYGHLAAHAIESVLGQSKKYDQVLFVDDGAQDCKHLEEIYGDNVDFVFRDKNLGVVANFQDMLMNWVKTDFVMFLGADNWLRSDTLEQLHDLLSYSYKDVVTYDIVVTGDRKQDITKNYLTNSYQGDAYWSRKFLHHGSMLYNTDLAKKVGGYAQRLGSIRSDEDYELWDRMVNYGATIGHIDQGLLYYRRHRENFNKY